jgi:hypothetical protein
MLARLPFIASSVAKRRARRQRCGPGSRWFIVGYCMAARVVALMRIALTIRHQGARGEAT